METTVTTDITSTSAISGGRISGNTEAVTAFGICWGTSAEPSINNSHTEADGSPESFASTSIPIRWRKAVWTWRVPSVTSGAMPPIMASPPTALLR
ncbi:MAG: hypothetical protein ACOYJE_06445 [Bacteroidaceae bacterium]